MGSKDGKLAVKSTARDPSRIHNTWNAYSDDGWKKAETVYSDCARK